MERANQKLTQEQLYQEQYRPQFHFTPRRNWMNDPNGLVYYKGEYHLFYQYHPGSSVWGPMHWGHAVSRDLVYWQHLPIALTPDEELGMPFSGSIIVDQNNTSGFFVAESGLVAIYTNCRIDEETGNEFQEQSIAYSTDEGRTWTKYSGNPVLAEPEIEDFRDPKVIWHQPSEKWVMVLACGDRVRFYGSTDLKTWNYLSEFGGRIGSEQGVWECPNLFQLTVQGNAEKKKWILEVDVQAGAPAGGSGAQYFIGKFDGKQFVEDNSPEDILWVDYGADFYAVQSWANFPETDEYKLWLGWMNNWNYAEKVPTEKWRGAKTVPRRVELAQTEAGVRLFQKPAFELEKLREEKISWEDVLLKEGTTMAAEDIKASLEIIAEFESLAAEELGIKINNAGNGVTVIGYKIDQEKVFVDRTKSGKVDFAEGFAACHSTTLRPEQGKIKLRLLLDWSSVELFANEGRVTITDLIFPEKLENEISFYVKQGEVQLSNLEIYSLKSIW